MRVEVDGPVLVFVWLGWQSESDRPRGVAVAAAGRRGGCCVHVYRQTMQWKRTTGPALRVSRICVTEHAHILASYLFIRCVRG